MGTHSAVVIAVVVPRLEMRLLRLLLALIQRKIAASGAEQRIASRTVMPSSSAVTFCQRLAWHCVGSKWKIGIPRTT